MQPRRSKPGPDHNPLLDAGQYMGLGLQFAGSILLFLFLGQWLDSRLGTEPWLLLFGVFGGAGLAFYAIYRKLVIEPARRARNEGHARKEEGEE